MQSTYWERPNELFRLRPGVQPQHVCVVRSDSCGKRILEHCKHREHPSAPTTWMLCGRLFCRQATNPISSTQIVHLSPPLPCRGAQRKNYKKQPQQKNLKPTLYSHQMHTSRHRRRQDWFEQPATRSARTRIAFHTQTRSHALAAAAAAAARNNVPGDLCLLVCAVLRARQTRGSVVPNEPERLQPSIHTLRERRTDGRAGVGPRFLCAPAPKVLSSARNMVFFLFGLCFCFRCGERCGVYDNLPAANERRAPCHYN